MSANACPVPPEAIPAGFEPIPVRSLEPVAYCSGCGNQITGARLAEFKGCTRCAPNRRGWADDDFRR